jgi:DNA-binding XRE family transcriptional regulator
MTVSLEEAMARLSPERQARIHARALELLAEEEELSLRDLRVLQRLTQQRVAETLGVEQDSVSRMEHRSDMLVSTMTRYVEAVGGKLTILAELPDRRPYHIVLSNLDSNQVENAG